MTTGKKPIFIHSLFRTGSTYIWYKFRQNGDYYCYYEPLHPVLSKATEDNIQDLLTKNFDSVNHPSLTRYYLYEYAPLLERDIPGVPYFKKSFSFDEFCNNENNPALKRYIDHLIHSVGDKIPLLQFNRTAFRVKWFKQNYPDSLNIYLVRQPRDQWQSYFEVQQKTNYPLFFVMDLLTASVNKETEYFKPLSQILPLVEYHDHSFEKEEKFYQLILDTYPGEERYFIFYYTWLRALIENTRYSDFILNINLLSREPLYREEVIGFLKKNDINDIDFEDSRVREYPSYSFSQEVMQEVEKKNRQLLFQSIPGKLINHFFEKVSSFDKKCFQLHKKSFFADQSKGLLPINYSSTVDELGKKSILLSMKFFRLEEENNRLRESINNKDKELRQKVQDLKQELQERDKQLAWKDEQLMQKGNELKQMLESKDQQLALKDLQLGKKDEQLMRKENELKQMLESKDQQLALKDLQLGKKDEESRQKEQELNQQLQEKNKQLIWKDAQLKQMNLLLNQKDNQIHEVDSRIQKIYRSYSYRVGKTIVYPIKKAKKISLELERVLKRGINKLCREKTSTGKMAFIDHSFHQKSNATFFLIDLLKKHYDITVFWDESWNKKPRVDLDKIVNDGFGTVVFFQIIHYPREVLKVLKGLNVIVIPMFDACWDLPDSYWDKFAHCKFINFSKALHERFKRLGLTSMYVQYFLAPGEFPVPSPRFESLRGFFWQRTEDITWDQIRNLIKNTEFEKFHIHGAVDPPGSNAKEGQKSYQIIVPSMDEMKKFNITMSNWYENPREYVELLQDFNVYFAPRKYEGIGMAFLEAMAMGKCVVAADNPTMNEYIEHGKNGLLYNPDNPEPLDLSQAEQISANARAYVKKRYKNWQKSQERIINFIKRPVEELKNEEDIVYHFNSHVSGGAAIAAMRIYEPLVKAGIKGKFYTLDNFKKTGYFQFSPSGDKSSLAILWLRFKMYIHEKKLNKYFKNRPGKYEVFSYTKLPYETPITCFSKLPALVHLHWISGFLDFPTFFESIPDDLPVIWTAHDMNPFTGGCHYSWECEKYQDGCDSCPQLNGYRNNNLSKINFKIKCEAIKNKNLHIVANSKWTEECARKSLLFKNARSFQTIYYGLDVNAFHPLDKSECRIKLALEVKPGTIVISFGADCLINRRKGFLELVQALKLLEKEEVEIVCLIFGHQYDTEINVKFQKKYLGFIRTPEALATMYSASDFFIMPSLYEAFGQTVIESMACETPVVGFNSGGIPELIDDGITGLLAKTGDSNDLAEKIKFMISNPEKRLTMGKKARETVENRFTLRHQVEKYRELYAQLLKK